MQAVGVDQKATVGQLITTRAKPPLVFSRRQLTRGMLCLIAFAPAPAIAGDDKAKKHREAQQLKTFLVNWWGIKYQSCPDCDSQSSCVEVKQLSLLIVEGFCCSVNLRHCSTVMSLTHIWGFSETRRIFELATARLTLQIFSVQLHVDGPHIALNCSHTRSIHSLYGIPAACHLRVVTQAVGYHHRAN